MLSRPLRDFSFVYIYPALERQVALRAGLFESRLSGAPAVRVSQRTATFSSASDMLSRAVLPNKLWF